jgi:uncharacterized protein (TIGR02145 family)
MLTPYLRKLDTASVSDRINLKVNIADTAGVLTPYLRKLDTASVSNRINLKVNIADTVGMLTPYLRKIDTASVSDRINLKVNIADTAGMLTPYLRKLDTASVSNRINLKVNIADTASMLTPYLRKLDTASVSNRINLKVNIADTSSMLEPYLREPDGPVPGDILYYNNDNKWARLPKGQDGQFLIMSSGLPTWTSIPTAPGPPTSVSANSGSSAQATVSFSAPAYNGGSTITVYTVTSNPGGITATGATSPINITGLTNGISYTFTVTATNSVGNSVASEASTVVTPVTVPGAPTGVVATAGNSSASVAFVAPVSNGGSAITGYTVTSNPGNFTASGATSPINVTGLTNGSAYTFTVIATTAVGNSVASAASTAVTPGTVPSAPTGAVATAGNTSASVAFVAPASNGGITITGYTVTSNPGGVTATGATSPINITGLTNGISYTFTVVATNSMGNSIASAASTAVTPNACLSPTIRDTSGNIYNTVTIGTQCWIKENLITSKYRNGGVIPNVDDHATWSNLNTGAWSHYDNQTSFNGIYGKLYNWYAVTDARGICPTGWHVPTDAEWTTLADFLGGPSGAGGKMKKTTDWGTPNVSADNSSGFSAIGAGFRGNTGNFADFGSHGMFWSTSSVGNGNAWFRRLNSYDGIFVTSSALPVVGLSVRCLRD